jgi:hypothetical protein
MSGDPKQPRQDSKSDFPEFWNVRFYHRIVRTTIARELRASFELSQDLPHRIVVLLMQLSQSRDKE